MYDGTCTLSLLPRNYPKRLEQLGIQCKVFAPMRPFLSTHQNNRDHRKIAVIDGRAAFTGGVNLADEYINRKERFGHWKDTAVMVQGEAVNSFTLMFLQLWNINVKEKEDYSKYMQYTSVIDRGMRNGGSSAAPDEPFPPRQSGWRQHSPHAGTSCWCSDQVRGRSGRQDRRLPCRQRRRRE